MKNKSYCILIIGAALAAGRLGLMAQESLAQAAPATNTNSPTPAQRALALLKPAADKLSEAKAFSFKTHSMVEVPSPVGQMINYFFDSEVAVERPNKLVSKKTGDGPAFDLYYDGKTFSGVDQKLGVYAQTDAPATLDALIPFVMEKTGIYFPCADMVYSDVYGNLTKDLTHAYWVDKSSVDGVLCDHLAFAGPGIEWQLWVGPEKDPLPRRLMVTLLSMERQPRFMVTFSDWKFKSGLPAKHFEFKKPPGANQIEFRPLTTNTNN